MPQLLVKSLTVTYKLMSRKPLLAWTYILTDFGFVKGELEPKVLIYDDISYKYADDLLSFISEATGVYRIKII